LKHGSRVDAEAPQPSPDFHVFEDMVAALHDMQDAYFQRWLGTWPGGIDWTRAVMGTHIAATLRTVSTELKLGHDNETAGYAAKKEGVISEYFADLIAYYFGEDAFAIRNQAYDDMLWVVLGWLESIQFVHEHSALFPTNTGFESSPKDETWYGNRWVPAFAHRARIFWQLAAKGWDTKLCGGGMIWNPRLMPYKNAITNQLFISASIGMYLYFPGDANTSPYGTSGSHLNPPSNLQRPSKVEWHTHDPVFGRAAQQAHKWLTSSNMTNSKGLYADGFHISKRSPGNTKCDERDEMVYTYNQGVILSGLLGLFQATGSARHLCEGHTLIQNVIRATGYDLSSNTLVDDLNELLPGQLPPWRGLGRAGVLEEACDASGKCSQDSQTFKGIWMHHFAAFCSPTALEYTHPHANLDETTIKIIKAEQSGNCRRYVGWLRHNAAAALGTRDKKGLFGMWWTAGLVHVTTVNLQLTPDALPPYNGSVDYRNLGVPRDDVWMVQADLGPREEAQGQKSMGGQPQPQQQQQQQHVDGDDSEDMVGKRDKASRGGTSVGDPNLRGRGRTLETQGGGLAVLRALWVVSKHEQ
jgi:hypothetical protein